MKKILLGLVIVSTLFVTISFISNTDTVAYSVTYLTKLNAFEQKQAGLLKLIQGSKLDSQDDLNKIRNEINQTRVQLKGLDFWLRYMEPISYKKINGPLPVEWETEVFEKFEPPYKREAAGLTLAYTYLDEDKVEKKELIRLVQESINATKIFGEDSITNVLTSYHHFYLCNRLYLLNLASIYTTGFECPDTERVIPEVLSMMKDIKGIYSVYNKNFASTAISSQYLKLYDSTIAFVFSQPNNLEDFDHFTFIQKYVNPLYALNQQLILEYKVSSKSLVDYSLNKNATSIFDKELYNGQSSKGVFLRVTDTAVLSEINDLGKLFFYDPLLSGNNLRSCASCHLPTQYFTDTVNQTSLQFNRTNRLPRNTPSLLNVKYNHLLMLDGAHITMQNQAKSVMIDSTEMGSNEKEVLQKILNCKEYKAKLTKLLAYTPQDKEITIEHITSALTIYYTKFSNYYSPFDQAMLSNKKIDPQVQEGFNLFMSKAQCATCHFVPQFNGVKPPYVSSEFEVIGVPSDNLFKALSSDKGRATIYQSDEMQHAFRTGSLRNIEYTKPYMHNGVFTNLTEVVDFYNGGGGAGRGLDVPNQTLSSDSLHLSTNEVQKIVLFMKSLNEDIHFEKPPVALPESKDKLVNQRKVGGEY